jgi:hypothetical protein
MGYLDSNSSDEWAREIEMDQLIAELRELLRDLNAEQVALLMAERRARRNIAPAD